MTFLLKDPDGLLDYLLDWGTDYLDTDAIVDSAWSVSPDEPRGVTIADSAFEPRSATVTAAGGVAGHIYRLTNSVTLLSGRTDRRSITLRVEQR